MTRGCLIDNQEDGLVTYFEDPWVKEREQRKYFDIQYNAKEASKSMEQCNFLYGKSSATCTNKNSSSNKNNDLFNKKNDIKEVIRRSLTESQL